MARTVCWTHCWNLDQPGVGSEHLVISDGHADGALVAPGRVQSLFRLGYRLRWDESWRLYSVALSLVERSLDPPRYLHLRADGWGRWKDDCGNELGMLSGCLDVDIWPTPFTHSLPIRRRRLDIGKRFETRVALIDGATLSVQSVRRAYTRLDANRYRIQSLSGPIFDTTITVDEDSIVIDQPGWFRRI
ncbi:putative glycolipid-binding domain-containing protein [Roseateles sp. NT4]|uniref:putative glycolipid-binding domain-containing protein n=1 Tax=Roseateles sp. NT4 TaxID=3453715 RepID=UPI003EEB8BBC